MQSHHFQYFNVISQKERKKKKEIQFFVHGQTPVSAEVSQFSFSAGRTDRWLVTVLTWSGNTKDLLSSETHVCVRVSVCGVLCGVLVWWWSVHGSLLGT